MPFRTALPFNLQEGLGIHVAKMIVVTFTSLCLFPASDNYRRKCWQILEKRWNWKWSSFKNNSAAWWTMWQMLARRSWGSEITFCLTQQQSHATHPSKRPTGQPTHRSFPPKTEKRIIFLSSFWCLLCTPVASGIAFTVLLLPPEFEWAKMVQPWLSGGNKVHYVGGR